MTEPLPQQASEVLSLPSFPGPSRLPERGRPGGCVSPLTDVETDSGCADRQAPGGRPPQASEGGLGWLGEVALEASLCDRMGLHRQLSFWPHGPEDRVQSRRSGCTVDGPRGGSVEGGVWGLPWQSSG